MSPTRRPRPSRIAPAGGSFGRTWSRPAMMRSRWTRRCDRPWTWPGRRSRSSRRLGCLSLAADPADEGFDRDRRQRLDLDRAARAQRDGEARDRLVVLRFDDVHEVVAAERRVLGDHAGAECFDVLVDFFDPARIRLERLDPGCGDLREENVRRHRVPPGRYSARAYADIHPHPGRGASAEATTPPR